ncbi:vascular endothelial growth factor D-like isoform X2 [Chrysoperla carnea]|uniref:vascular endothelial growth factor D-like isoform X2 n=1 Tax=Chrysoperla carnea TaxID=189513 RepID=UPI001D06F44E|nr:vascular endothelial growth factor D-like isoform X2 [Chrysoperla carnea]
MIRNFYFNFVIMYYIIGAYQIPMSLLREINGVASLDDFVDRYVDGATDSISLTSRFGESEERSGSQMLLHAGCSPEFVTVPIEVDGLDSNTIIHPSCVRVKRCGGCCDAVSDCQPTSTGKEMVSAIIKVFTYNHDTNKFGFVRNEIVPLETHTECECGCKRKPEHCLSYQKYYVEDCACRCNNTDEEDKCESHDRKIWNPDTCTCKCQEEEDCATGYFFDENTCECMDETLTTRRPISDVPKSIAENERIKQERNKLKVKPILN